MVRLQGKLVKMTADVTDVNEQGNRYTIETGTINGEERKRSYYVYAETWEAEVGDKITFQTMFSPFNTYRNYGLMDRNLFLKARSIDGEFYVSDPIISKTDGAQFKNRLRLRFVQYTKNAFEDHIEHSNLDSIRSMILGKSSQSEMAEDFMVPLGLSHLMAVSGLHIGILFYAVSTLLLFIGLHRFHSELIALFIILFYAWLIQFPVSALRALLFLTVVTLSNRSDELLDRRKMIFFVLAVIISINTFSIYDPALWLSFGSVLAIETFYPFMRRSIYFHSVPDSVLFIASLQIAMLPLQFYYFNRYPLMSIPANLLMVPVFSALIVLSYGYLMIAWIPYLSSAIFGLLTVGVRIVDGWFRILGTAKDFAIAYRSPQPIELVAFFTFLLLFMYRHRLYVFSIHLSRKIFKLSMLTVISTILLYEIMGFVAISMIDIGQGDAFMIQSRSAQLLIDTGGDLKGSGYQYALKPLLTKRGVDHLDAIYLSHMDLDHVGNYSAIVEDFRVSTTFVSSPYDEEGLTPLKEGDRQSYGLFSIRTLFEGKQGSDENQKSNVLLLEVHGRKVLFTGDIDQAIEEMIVEKIPTVDVLKVAHHGSVTGSSHVFLEKTKPKIALISVGKNNRYGHPTEEVVHRFQQNSSSIYRTDQQGEVWVLFHRLGYHVHSAVESNLMVMILYALTFLGAMGYYRMAIDGYLMQMVGRNDELLRYYFDEVIQ